jgi:hypothetical protein
MLSTTLDPANRLVAAELERRWNETLAHVEEVRREASERLSGVMRELSEVERERVRRMTQTDRKDKLPFCSGSSPGCTLCRF